MKANEKYLTLSKEARRRIISNVRCGNCSDVTTIVHYIIEDGDHGIVIKGKCKNCGQDVARVVD
ncbi:hypothetical protein LRR81_08485 [Metabacillus sp. GX 13764]|uniref:hypothetical protein n=1 Tax=Metabacillus kandeliae TaxID=2900151 RepID=UPI001E5FBE18|nr:hypothetical protein [Metabacillus kandeliae]MCD7034269.1 hypothetical protein [Metabacillus kandeliae]